MSLSLSANERFRQRLDIFYNYISNADQGRIGGSALPEFYSYSHEARELILRYRFEDWMLNCNGVMHGGIVSLLMDSSMGWMACTWPEQELPTPTPSISMHTTFLEPVFPDDYVLVKVRLTALKSHIAYISASLYKENNPEKILVSATGEYYRIKHPVYPT